MDVRGWRKIARIFTNMNWPWRRYGYYLDRRACGAGRRRVWINVKWYRWIQINQQTRCNSFTSLLLGVYVWLNMFRASPRPSSGAYNYTRSLWFYRWREAAGVFLVVVWQDNLPDHDQKRSSLFSPTVKPEAPSAVVCSWWRAGRRPKHVESHVNIK